jgi:Uma2 family endonuclease
MSPERISGHNDIKTRLTSVLDTLVSAEQLGTVFSDGVLFINEAADLACEPDLMYGSVETIRSARITFHAWQSSEEGNVELHGSPDMVAEIVSD